MKTPATESAVRALTGRQPVAVVLGHHQMDELLLAAVPTVGKSPRRVDFQ